MEQLDCQFSTIRGHGEVSVFVKDVVTICRMQMGALGIKLQRFAYLRRIAARKRVFQNGESNSNLGLETQRETAQAAIHLFKFGHFQWRERITQALQCGGYIGKTGRYQDMVVDADTVGGVGLAR